MAQKAKVSISISALFEPGQGFVLDMYCISYLFCFHFISYFVFIIGFYLNLVGDMCKTFNLDFSMQWGICKGRNMYYIFFVFSLYFVPRICISVLLEPVGGFALDRTWEKKQV